MKKRLWIVIGLIAMTLMVSACGNSRQKVTEKEGASETQEVNVEIKEDKEVHNTEDSKSAIKETKEEGKKEKTAKKEEPQQAEAPMPVEGHGKLSVKGTQLVDANGKPYQLKGVSTHGINWFPEYIDKEGFRTMRDQWGINCVRFAMYTAESNSYCEGGNKEELKALVNKGVEYATELGLYCIIDWHILHDLDPNKYKSEAIPFFEEMSKKYADYDNVLYEICNEPNGGTSWSQVKAYAKEVIPVIKNNDSDAIIIVGTPTWSQDVDIAAKDPVEGYDNIMYTIHFYADTHRDNIRQKMITALDAGIPVICTEFGICDAGGSGANNIDEGNTWIKTLNDNGVSYCIWNLSNKGETSSLIQSGCQKTSGWTKDELSEAGKWYVGVLGNNVEKLNTDTQDTANNSQNQEEQKDRVEQKEKNSEKKEEGKKGDLKATIGSSNSWSDGSKQFYQYDLSVKNEGASPVQGWTIQLDFEETITLDQSWNGNFSVEGTGMTITPVEYNENLEKNQAADVGFIICVSKEIKNPKVTIK